MTRLSWTPSIEAEAVVSYSQNAEDVRLWRVFRGEKVGFYVDVGAADPSIGSVTRLFYDRGWSGLNVEPSPAFEALRDARPRDVNVQAAVGELEGRVPFYVTYPDLGMSTLDLEAHAYVQEAVERVEEITVQKTRLATILDEYARQRTTHFLKVDVEGAELQVFRGALETLRRHRPTVWFEHGAGSSDHYGTTAADVHRLLVGEVGLRIFDADGTGPYSEARFEAVFNEPMWSFVAHP